MPRSSGILPVACAASTWKMMPRARQISPIAAMSCTTPISLLTAITETTIVSGRSAFSNASRSSEPVRQHVEIGDRVALALELAHRVERRLVLRAHGDEVLALVLVEVRGALQREIDRFRRARREDELARVAVDERGDLLARLLDRLLGGPAQRVRARRRVAEILGEARESSSARRAGRPAWSRSSRGRSESSLQRFHRVACRRSSGHSAGDGRARRRASAAAGPAAP